MTSITQKQIDAMTKCVKFTKWARVEMEAGRLVHTPEGDGWQPIETAPKDVPILVYFNHDAAPYHTDKRCSRLSDYHCHAESGDCTFGSGMCFAQWMDGYEDGNEMEGEPVSWMPAFWFALENDECVRVVNPTHWMPLPTPPETATDEPEPDFDTDLRRELR